MSDMNDRFPQGYSAAGGTGGGSHSHSLSGNGTTGSGVAGTNDIAGGSTTFQAYGDHTHSWSISGTDNETVKPSYRTVIFARPDADIYWGNLPLGAIAMFYEIPGAKWTVIDNFNGYFPYGSATGDGTSNAGNASTHTHSITITIGSTNTGTTTADGSATTSDGVLGSSHSHPDISFNSGAPVDGKAAIGLPEYSKVLFAELTEALAVELISFEAIARYEEVIISWQTEVEIDNKKWLIARTTRNVGADFICDNISHYEIIAEVPVKGVGGRYVYPDSLVKGGVAYWYLLGDISTQGDTTWHNELLTSATPKTYKIVGFALHQNYPNPFAKHTTIRYSVPGKLPGPSKSVRLSIYNISGRLVHTLLDCKKAPGNYLVKWDGKSARGLPLPSGVYFYNLKVGTKKATNKLFFFH